MFWHITKHQEEEENYDDDTDDVDDDNALSEGGFPLTSFGRLVDHRFTDLDSTLPARFRWRNIHDDPCVKQSEPVIAKFGFYFLKTISDHFLYIFPIQYYITLHIHIVHINVN